MGKGRYVKKLSLVLAAAALSSGCATIVTGSVDNITIETEPPQAACVVTRDGVQEAIVNPTPGTFALRKSKRDIVITCNKEGYEQSVGSLSSDLQPAFLGNILIGGLIPAAVDWSTGAYVDYPPTITIPLIETPRAAAPLPPTFEDQRAQIQREYFTELDRITVACGADAGLCGRMKAAADNIRDQQIRILEQRMGAAASGS